MQGSWDTCDRASMHVLSPTSPTHSCRLAGAQRLGGAARPGCHEALHAHGPAPASPTLQCPQDPGMRSKEQGEGPEGSVHSDDPSPAPAWLEPGPARELCQEPSG